MSNVKLLPTLLRNVSPIRICLRTFTKPRLLLRPCRVNAYSFCRSSVVPDLHTVSLITASRHLSYDAKHANFIEAVKSELKADDTLREKQLRLLTSITNDVSDTTKELLAKLNCETNLSSEEIYDLAVAVFQSRDKLTDGEQIAAGLFEYAGELGDANAAYTYAQLLRTGQGVSADASRAAQIMTDLSMKGHPYAQFTLAGMYYGGTGVEQNFNRAFTLYKVSSQNFVPQAHNIIGEMYKHGQGVPEDMNEAVACYKKGAELGDPMAHLSLAVCYSHGNGVEQSVEKAFEHHQEASKSGHPIALYNLGGHYFSGKGVELSFDKAAEYYKMASDVGFAPAQVNLGNMYYNGLGVPMDRAKAKELYKLAADRDKNAKALLEELELEEKKELEEAEEEKYNPDQDGTGKSS